jgi:hypothetical protein
MDIVQYQKDRNSELAEFQKEYTDLKVEYTRLLTDAIYESDPEKQSALVDQILSVNSSLLKLVNDFIASAAGKYDPKTVADLTQDIINYQKEYTEIKDSKNKASSLQKVLSKQHKQLYNLKHEFNIMLMCLIFGLFVVLILIFTTTSGIPQLLPLSLRPNTSMMGQ